MPDHFWIPLVAGLAGFVALWPISLRLRDASIVDFAWAPGFLVQLSIALALIPEAGARTWVVFGLVAVWSARLTVTLTARRVREGHEDPRYTAIREGWGHAFWWKSLFIVFILQAVLQWLIVSGAIAGAAAPVQELGAVAALGAAVALAGLVLESVADRQLDRFKRRHGSGVLMTVGLRRHVRHPNYTGEILFWLGIAVIGLDGGAWLAVLSPILIAALLVLVSGAPILDERLGSTRPDYAAYRSRTPAFLPFPRGGEKEGLGESDGGAGGQ